MESNRQFNDSNYAIHQDYTFGTYLHWYEIKPRGQCNLPSNRNCHSATLFRHYMVVFGGKEGDGKKKFVNDIHIFDLENRIWLSNITIEGVPPEPRMGHSGCLFDLDKIFIYGGWNGSKVLDDVYILELNDNPYKLEWKVPQLEKILPKRQFHTTNILGSTMYIFGGGDGKHWLNDLLSVDLNTFKWTLHTTKGKCPVGRLQHSSALIQQKLYVFGGEPDRLRQLCDFFVLDLETLTWIELNPIGNSPSARVSASAQARKNKIFFFGGFDGTNWRNDMFIYNIDENMWEETITKGIFPRNRCRHSSLIYENDMIIFGGNDSEKSFNDIFGLPLKLKINNKDSRLIKDLKNMFKEKLFCDVIFCIEGEEISAHRNILATRCEHFKTMFTSELSESQTKKVVITDVKLNVFIAFLKYLYYDDVDFDEKMAIELMILANRFLLPELIKVCETLIAQKLSVKNIIEIINTAEKHNATYLKQSALNFMIDNKELICATQNINLLSKSILVELYKIRK